MVEPDTSDTAQIIFGSSASNEIKVDSGTLTVSGVQISGGSGTIVGNLLLENNAAVASSSLGETVFVDGDVTVGTPISVGYLEADFGGTTDLLGNWFDGGQEVVSVNGATLTSTLMPMNYDGASGTLTGGQWSIERGGVITLGVGVATPPISILDALVQDVGGTFTNLAPLRQIGSPGSGGILALYTGGTFTTQGSLSTVGNSAIWLAGGTLTISGTFSSDPNTAYLLFPETGADAAVGHIIFDGAADLEGVLSLDPGTNYTTVGPNDEFHPFIFLGQHTNSLTFDLNPAGDFDAVDEGTDLLIYSLVGGSSATTPPINVTLGAGAGTPDPSDPSENLVTFATDRRSITVTLTTITTPLRIIGSLGTTEFILPFGINVTPGTTVTLVAGAGPQTIFNVAPSGGDNVVLVAGGGTNTINLTEALVPTDRPVKPGQVVNGVGPTIDMTIINGKAQLVYGPIVGQGIFFSDGAAPPESAADAMSTLALQGTFQSVIAGDDSTIYTAPAGYSTSSAPSNTPGTNIVLDGTGNTVYAAAGATIQSLMGGQNVVQNLDPSALSAVEAYSGVTSTLSNAFSNLSDAAQQAFVRQLTTGGGGFLVKKGAGTGGFTLKNGTGGGGFVNVKNVAGLGGYLAASSGITSFLDQDAAGLAQVLASDPALEAAFIASNSTAISLFLATDPALLAGLLQAQDTTGQAYATDVANFIASDPTAQSAFVQADAGGIAAYIASLDPSTLSTVLKNLGDPGALSKYGNGGLSGQLALQNYLAGSPTVLQGLAPSTLAAYLTASPTVLNGYLNNPVDHSALVAYLQADPTAAVRYISTDPNGLQEFLGGQGNASALASFLGSDSTYIQSESEALSAYLLATFDPTPPPSTTSTPGSTSVPVPEPVPTPTLLAFLQTDLAAASAYGNGGPSGLASLQAFLASSTTDLQAFLNVAPFGTFQAFLTSSPTSIQSYLASNPTALQGFAQQNPAIISQFIISSSTNIIAYAASDAAALSAYIVDDQAALSEFLQSNAAASAGLSTGNVSAVQSFLQQHPDALGSFLASNVSVLSQYLAANTAGLGPYLSSNPAALTQFLQADLSFLSEYLRNDPAILSGYLFRNINTLTEYFSGDANALTDFLGSDTSVVQQYLENSPSTLVQYFSANVSALQGYLAANPSVFQSYLLSSPASLESYLSDPNNAAALAAFTQQNMASVEAFLLKKGAGAGGFTLKKGAGAGGYVDANLQGIAGFLKPIKAGGGGFLESDAASVSQALVESVGSLAILSVLENVDSGAAFAYFNGGDVGLENYLATNVADLTAVVTALPYADTNLSTVNFVNANSVA